MFLSGRSGLAFSSSEIDDLVLSFGSINLWRYFCLYSTAFPNSNAMKLSLFAKITLYASKRNDVELHEKKPTPPSPILSNWKRPKQPTSRTSKSSPLWLSCDPMNINFSSQIFEHFSGSGCLNIPFGNLIVLVSVIAIFYLGTFFQIMKLHFWVLC